MPLSGTGWPGRGLRWEGRCRGTPFPSFLMGIYATTSVLMAKIELELTGETGNFLFAL